MRSATDEMFWGRVQIDESIFHCWPWLGSVRKKEDGYGQVTRHGRNLVSHRVAYELAIGEIPSDLELDHLCRNRICCNPFHLEPVTSKENCHRGISQPAVNATITHCKNGHEFTDANTYQRHRAGGGRICKTCILLRQVKRRARMKLERK